VATGSDRTLVVECKYRDLTENQARDIIEKVLKKAEFIPHLSGLVIGGVAARSIMGKEKLIQEGYFVWDFNDLNNTLRHVEGDPSPTLR
jgi:hypothetical protein